MADDRTAIFDRLPVKLETHQFDEVKNKNVRVSPDKVLRERIGPENTKKLLALQHQFISTVVHAAFEAQQRPIPIFPYGDDASNWAHKVFKGNTEAAVAPASMHPESGERVWG